MTEAASTTATLSTSTLPDGRKMYAGILHFTHGFSRKFSRQRPEHNYPGGAPHIVSVSIKCEGVRLREPHFTGKPESKTSFPWLLLNNDSIAQAKDAQQVQNIISSLMCKFQALHKYR